jgi:hypothetical protein
VDVVNLGYILEYASKASRSILLNGAGK